MHSTKFSKMFCSFDRGLSFLSCANLVPTTIVLSTARRQVLDCKNLEPTRTRQLFHKTNQSVVRIYVIESINTLVHYTSDKCNNSRNVRLIPDPDI